MQRCIRCGKDAKVVLDIYDLGYAYFRGVVPLCCSCLVKVIRELVRQQDDGLLPVSTRWHAHKLAPSA